MCYICIRFVLVVLRRLDIHTDRCALFIVIEIVAVDLLLTFYVFD